MTSRPTSIRRRLMSILLSTSTAVVLVTSAVFCTYELLTFRQTTASHLSTLSQVVASNSTAALAFDDRADAAEILGALRAESDLTIAALYDAQGDLFSTYPPERAPADFPSALGPDGVRYAGAHLEAYQPVIQGQRRLGTLYLRSNLGEMYRRLSLYGSVVVLVVAGSLLVAYALSRVLQNQISQPILALAEAAKAVSTHRDYSIRVPPLELDELGVLTRAFNHMLTQIHERDQALREGADRMRAVLDSALSAVVVIDARGRVVDWTARAEDVFGWPRDEALGRDLADTVVPPRHHQVYRRALQAYLATGESRFFGRAIETTALRRNGSEFPVELSVSPLKTGRTITFCGFVTDITERKQAEEESRRFHQQLEDRVAERTEQLENANRELEAFSYSVSHDLRAPLRHIDGFTQMLQKHAGEKLDGQGLRYLATISEAARNMGRLIDDLLAFSRTGRAALNIVPVDHDALVADVITGGGLGRERPIDWRVDPLPAVQADPGLLRLVWTNLIGNAVKYTGQRQHPRIEIGAGPHTREEFVFHVRDNGVGFDMRYSGKLFGVFQRLHGNTEFEGTGIGLAHVKRIIGRHGGRVWAEGQPDVGATFYFSLPLTPVADPDATNAA